MSSSVMMMILLLFYIWILCSTTDTFTTNYFNQKIWFDDGNIFHIEQKQFWTVFQQHRNNLPEILKRLTNLNEIYLLLTSINWLANEISLINRQIKLVKDQIAFVIHTHEQRINLSQKTNATINSTIPLSPNNNNSHRSSSSIKKLKNHRNIYILKLLSNELLFNGYLQDLIDIYEILLITTIECIAIVIEQNSIEKYLFIKLSDGTIDKYQINKTKLLKETLWKIHQPISIWNNNGKQPEYYRRFIQDNQKNEIMITDQLIEIKNRPKINDVNFFDMMGQILRIKYHIDPSSLSCILETFFDNIYTCDGRLIHPHELKLLSDDNDLFVFYAIMMDTTTEKQIYPLDTNNHVLHGDQIFFLFNTHPQFNSLSSLTCPDCPQPDQTYLLNNNEGTIEKETDDQIIESQIPIDNIVQNSSLINPQNIIVYTIVTSILLYILFSIYLGRKQESTEYLVKRHSLSSRRGQ